MKMNDFFQEFIKKDKRMEYKLVNRMDTDNILNRNYDEIDFRARKDELGGTE